jgi:hypothetical protein
LGSFAKPPSAYDSSIAFDSPRALETARAFYDGMNLLLRNGDRELESTLAPDFVEHPPDNQSVRTAQAMIEDLLDARVLWPSLRMTVASLDQHDSMIVARLRIEPGTTQAISGLLLENRPPTQVTEYLRVDGVGVSERWSADLDLPRAAFAVQTDLPWNTRTLTTPAIERITLEPGERVQIPLEGRAMVQVENGVVQLDHDGIDLDGMPQIAAEPIPAGGARFVDATDAVLARNISSDAALVWVFAVDTGQVPLDGAAIRVSSFIALKDAAQHGTRQRLSVARVTLPAGALVTAHAADIAEVIVVIDGAIEVTIEDGQALVSPDGATTYLVDDRAAITAGDGISMRDGSTLGYRVTGPQPATLLVMRIDSASIASRSPHQNVIPE